MPVPEPMPPNPLNAGFVLVLTYYDNSGIIATWGPFASEDEAAQASADLATWPIERGNWEIFPMLRMPVTNANPAGGEDRG